MKKQKEIAFTVVRKYGNLCIPDKIVIVTRVVFFIDLIDYFYMLDILRIDFIQHKQITANIFIF